MIATGSLFSARLYLSLAAFADSEIDISLSLAAFAFNACFIHNTFNFAKNTLAVRCKTINAASYVFLRSFVNQNMKAYIW